MNANKTKSALLILLHVNIFDVRDQRDQCFQQKIICCVYICAYLRLYAEKIAEFLSNNR